MKNTTSLPHIVIYTDGACQGNPGPGGWGVVLIDAAGQTVELSGGEPRTTNNRMEISAATHALEHLTTPHKVTLYTDSQYLRQTMQGNYRRHTNHDLWERLDAARTPHEIRWQWVKGHTGDTYNERADRLAVAAVAQHGGKATAAPQATTTPRLVAQSQAQIMVYLRVVFDQSSKQAHWAAVLADQTTNTQQTERGSFPATSEPHGQLGAAAALVRRLPTDQTIVLLTDSDYLAKGAGEWVRGWRKNGWMTKAGKPVAHQALWQTLDELNQQRRITWQYESAVHALGRAATQLLP
jgi:ribonuclease HI